MDESSLWIGFVVVVAVASGIVLIPIAILRYLQRRNHPQLASEGSEVADSAPPVSHPAMRSLQGLTVVAVGAWVELALWVEPIVVRLLSPHKPHDGSLIAGAAWQEISVLAGSIVRWIGLLLCLRMSLSPKEKILLGASILFELIASVAIAFTLWTTIQSREFGVRLATGTALSFSASYIAAILLLILLRAKAGEFPPRKTEIGRVTWIPVLLLTEKLFELVVVNLPEGLVSPTVSTRGPTLLLVIALLVTVAVSWGRLLWLYFYGKALRGFGRAT